MTLLFLIGHLVGWSQNLETRENHSVSYIFPIEKSNNVYSGEGIDWVINKRDSTQYYLFGEQHGISDIPAIVGFLHNTLSQYEDYQLALEIDKWTAQKIAELGVKNVVVQYSFSLAFDYDEEIELINAIEERGNIWGLDQMLTAIHPYRRLAELAPNENARRLAQGAFLKASLRAGAYLREPHFSDVNSLRDAFGQTAADEAKLLMDQIELSMKIYNKWVEGQKGDISPVVANEIRERLMLQQFNAYSSRNPAQKVIFKMGGAHINRGIGKNGVKTLGSYVYEHAQRNNQGALNIGLFNYHEGLHFINKAAFEQSDIVLLDCQEYLKQMTDSLSSNLTKSDQLLLTGYDALIIFNCSEKSTRKFVVEQEKKFKSNLIRSISVGGVFILGCLALLFPCLRYVFNRSKTTEDKIYGGYIIQMLITSLVLVFILVFQVYYLLKLPGHAMVLPGNQSIWIYLVITGLAAYFLYRVVFLVSRPFSSAKKLFVGVGVISLLGLVAFMYYWNIGGMIYF